MSPKAHSRGLLRPEGAHLWGSILQENKVCPWASLPAAPCQSHNAQGWLPARHPAHPLDRSRGVGSRPGWESALQ